MIVPPVMAPLVAMLVTVPVFAVAPVAMPSSFVLSALVITPARLVDAAATEVLLPVLLVIVTAVVVLLLPRLVATLTCAPAAMPSSFDLSAALIEPAALVVAAEMPIVPLVVIVPPVIGALVAMLVTVPVPALPLLAEVIRPCASTVMLASV